MIRRSSQVMLVRKYDLPLAGAPITETYNGASCVIDRGTVRWQRGQAKTWHGVSRASIASPLAVKRLGRNRSGASGPRTGSPKSSAWRETQSSSSTGNTCQQCGHVTRGRIVAGGGPSGPHGVMGSLAASTGLLFAGTSALAVVAEADDERLAETAGGCAVQSRQINPLSS